MAEHKQNESQVQKKKKKKKKRILNKSTEELSVQNSGGYVSLCIESSGSFVSK